MIDTHAHIHDPKFDKDRTAVVDRARSSGVTEIVTVGCDIADSQRAIRCADRFELWATVGVHPHEAKDAPDDLTSAFAALLAHERVLAIGETGLDYYYDHSPRDAQRGCLRTQLRIARSHDLPVIFHHRDAFDDFVSILEDEWQEGMRGVVHCFTGDTEQAQEYVERFQLKLGVGGIITFRNAQPVRDALVAVGIEACVLETDCPYLAPVPHRGERNEPAFVVDTANALAQILHKPITEVVEATDRNARALFGLALGNERRSVPPG